MTPELLKDAMEPGEIGEWRVIFPAPRYVVPAVAYYTDPDGCIRDLSEMLPPNCS